MMNDVVIGIDLGTTNSLCTVIINGRVTFVSDSERQVMTPSIISVTENNEILIGRTAQNRLITHPENTASVFKRKMGTDEAYRLGSQTFKAYELSGFILRKIKTDAEVFLQQEVKKAVISVPAYFNNKQRQDTIKAAQLAGLEVVQLINEPTAAALAYGIDYLGNTSFLVFDLGGGTFDVTFLEIYKDLFEVKAMSGDSALGGEDFTRIIYEYIQKYLPVQSNQLKQEEKSFLWKIAEESKKQVDFGCEKIEFMFRNHFLSIPFSQEVFYVLSEELFKQLLIPIQRVLNDANNEPIDRVIFVGGATRMGVFRKFIEELLATPEAADLLDHSLNPDEAIALGIGHAIGILTYESNYKNKILSDIAPFSLGVETVHDEFSPIIERNTHLPISQVNRYNTIRDNQTRLRVKILQGENIRASRNLEIGSFYVTVPKNKAGKEFVDLQFTYDISGVLGIKATVVSTGVEETLVYHIDGNTENTNSEFIEKYQILPREEEVNYQILSQALLYSEQITGDDKEILAAAIKRFEFALDKKSRIDILKTREYVEFLISKFDKPVKIVFRKKSVTEFDDILN